MKNYIKILFVAACSMLAVVLICDFYLAVRLYLVPIVGNPYNATNYLVASTVTTAAVSLALILLNMLEKRCERHALLCFSITAVAPLFALIVLKLRLQDITAYYKSAVIMIFILSNAVFAGLGSLPLKNNKIITAVLAWITAILSLCLSMIFTFFTVISPFAAFIYSIFAAPVVVFITSINLLWIFKSKYFGIYTVISQYVFSIVNILLIINIGNSFFRPTLCYIGVAASLALSAFFTRDIIYKIKNCTSK